MKIKQFLLEFIVFFCITFVASTVVSFIYSYFVHGLAEFDWAMSFRTALLFALVFPIIDLVKPRNKKK